MGVWGGSAFYDNCNVCSGGTSGHVADSDIDDCGICFGNNINDLGCGCFVDGPENFWYDEDGDGLGFGESEIYCEVDAPYSWVSNNDDQEPLCETNDTDYCGVCAGGGLDDLGCGCFNPAALEYWYDEDGDGLGYGDPTEYCLDNIPDGWVLNDDDQEPLCETNDTDYCGVCAGGGLDDLGCGCFNPAALEYWYDSDGDGLGYGESSIFCLQDLPDNWVLNQDDEEPSCPTNDTDYCGVCAGENADLDCEGICFGDAELDNCGTCDNDPENDCLVDCMGVWGGPAFYDTCDVCSGGISGHIADSDIDDCGICFGENSADVGCGCFAPSPQEYWYDFDGDGLGYGENSELYCSELGDVLTDNNIYEIFPDGWVLNNDDLEPDCVTNNTDECSVCNGGGVSCAPPLNISANGGRNQISLSWSMNINAVSYNIYYQNDTLVSSTQELSYVDSNLDYELDYCYYITSINDLGVEGPASETVCATTLPYNLVELQAIIYPSDGFVEVYMYNLWQVSSYSYELELSSDLIEAIDVTGFLNPTFNQSGNIYSIQNTYSEQLINPNPEGILLNTIFFEPTDVDFEEVIYLGIDNYVFNDELSEELNVCNLNSSLGDCSINESFTFEVDCDGVWFGDAFIDDCLECVGGLTGVSAGWAKDCNGDCFGDAIIDDCGDCSQGNTGLEENYSDIGCGCYNPAALIYCDDTDGDGLGNSGTETEFCLDEVSNGWILNCSDPEPDCVTNNTDSCGVCGGGDAADLGCGCFNPAAQEYWYDEDDDGLGYGESSLFCLDNIPEGWLSNNYDQEPLCPTNDTDYCGVCGGGGLDDLGCGCFNPAALEYWYDADGDGLGYGSPNLFCLDEVPENWVLNNYDPEPLCETNDSDYCGVCAGTGEDDLGCGCFNPAALSYCLDSDGDGLGNPGSDTEFCLQDLPENWIFDCSDLEPECSTNNTDQCGICNGDGLSCLGCTDEEAWNCPSCSSGNIDATIDDGSCIYQPEDFYFEQSTMQGFYFVISADVLDVELEADKDWIGIFNNNICVGSRPWEGEYTSVPAMGDDGSVWTEGYLQSGDFPTFKIFDYSENAFYDTESINILNTETLDYSGWQNLAFFEIERLRSLVPDCAGIPDGLAYIDDCGQCVEGSTDQIENWAKDCNGDCFGDAFLDDCEVCSGGNSEHIENSDNIGCGCFNPAALQYWYDADGDGFGSGEAVSLCLDNVVDGWVENALDQEPFCPNDSIEELLIDDCGVCNGNNLDLDCNGVCFGGAEYDACGECGGDGSACFRPVVFNQSVDVNEDSILELVLIAEDPNDDILEFFIVDLPIHGTLSIQNEVVTYEPNLNYFGIDEFSFYAYDGEWESEIGIVSINVQSINDPPIVTDVDVETDEDEEVSIQLLGTDIDSNTLDYFIIDELLLGSLTQDDNVVIFDPYDNVNGIDSFRYIASDGDLVSDTAFVNIQVLPINDAPFLYEILDVTINEGETFEYLLDASDIDGDNLYYSGSVDGDANLEIIDDILFISPIEGFNGYINVDIFVTDGLMSDTQSFTLEVLPVNDPPELSFISSQVIDEDTNLELSLSANDIDGDDLVYSASVDSNAEIIINENLLIVSPNDNYNGDILVTVDVSDGEFLDSQEFILTVSPINDDPFIVNIINDVEVLEGSDEVIIDLSNIFYDFENGNNLSYTVYESIMALEVSIIDNQLYLNFNEQQFGSGEVIVTASDNISRAVASITFDVNIIEQNDPPEVSDLILSLEEDTSVEFSILAYDIEDDDLSYEILSSPSNGSIESVSSSSYIYTPLADYYGEDSLSVIVSDGINQTVSEILLNISSINDDPIFETIDIPDATENLEYEYEILVSDIDNDVGELTLSIISAPNWLGLEGFELVGTPSFNDDGEYDIILELSDGVSASSSNYNLVVINQNQAPIVSDINLTTLEETLYSFDLNGVDAEDDNLTFTYSEPDNGDLIVDGASCTYMPNADFYGYDSFTYYANDGLNNSNIATVNIQVININDIPEAQSVDFDVSVNPFNFNLEDYVYDADMENNEYLSFTSVPPSSSNNSFQTMFGGEIIHNDEYNFSYTLPETVTPSDFLLYKVSDGMAESEIQIITFNLYGRTWPRNSPPSAFNDNVNLEEDNSIDLTLVGFDLYYPFPQDGSESITIISNPTQGTLLNNPELQESDLGSLAQWKIEYQPNNNYSGIDSIVYQVENPNNEFGASLEAVIYININEINDIPYMEQISDIEILEDSTDNILLNYLDVDNELSVSVESSNENITVNFDDDLESIVISPSDNYYGSGYATVTINEVGGEELSISQTFNINIVPVNDSPILSDIDDQIINEDELLLLSLNATDIDYVSYEFEATSSDNIILNIDNNLLQISGVQNYHGEESVTVTVFDNQGATDSQTFNVIILPINDAPLLSEIEIPAIQEDNSYLLSVEIIDLDSDEFSVTITEPNNISFDLGESVLTDAGMIQSIIISPESNWYGTRVATISVSDGEYIDSQQIIINIQSVNDAPIINDIENQAVIEDESIDIFIEGFDVDGDEILYSVVESNNCLTNIIGNTLSVLPDENYNGQLELIVSASDGILNSETSFFLDVVPANDAPTIESIPNQQINEGTSFIYELSSNDIDGDQLNYSIINIDNGASGSFENDIMTITPISSDWDGDINITISVADGEYSVFTSFILSVINVNEPPISQSQNIQIDEDNSITITLDATDPDGDDLLFEIVNAPIYGSIQQDNNIIIYTPDLNYFGEDSLTFFANDGEYISSIETVTININSVNDAPQLGVLEEQVVDEGGLLIYQLDIIDDNYEEIEINVISEQDIDFNISSGYVLTLSTVDPDFYGLLDVRIELIDGEYIVEDILEVIINPINDPPILNAIDDITINEDEILTYLVNAEDIDSDNLYFGAQAITDGVIEFNNNLLTFTPNTNFNGSVDISVYVNDGEYTDLVTFTVFIAPINDPPILEVIGNQDIDEDNIFTYTIDVLDPEDDSIIYSVDADTTNADINIDGNTLIVSPNINWYGEIIISVNITDGEYDDSESFILTVNAVNDVPLITSAPSYEAYEDIEYIYELEIEDPDDNSFEYILINNPEGMTISNEGVISWTPAEGVLSSGLVGVVVWDTYPPEEYDIPAYQEFIINVIPVNDSPIITSSAPTIATEDILYEYNIEIEDPDSDMFSVSLINGPDDMEIIDNTTLQWLPLEGVVSSGIVTISVSDNHPDNPLFDTQDFMITVVPVNDPPVIISNPDTLAYVGELYEYQVVVEDPDDESFSYILSNHPENMEVNDFGLIQWTPTSAGIFGPITIEVFDGGEDGVESVQQLFIVVAEHISPLITMEFRFNQTANLISFLGIPEDSTVASVFEPLGGNALAVIGEGQAAQHLPNGLWVGSLQTISPTSGYWLQLDEPEGELLIEAYPTDPNIIYNLGMGQNLISYVSNDNVSIQDAISDEFENYFETIIGQGQAAQRLPNGLWVGSLTHLNTLKGYWVKISDDIDFQWNYSDELNRSNHRYQKPKEHLQLDEFDYKQSSQQAFYFFENITIDGEELLDDDWVIAYNQNNVVGYSKYSGSFLDVPVMGEDQYTNRGYCIDGDLPIFKVFRESTGELIDMNIDSDQNLSWGNNQIYNVKSLTDYVIPEQHKLLDAYPNPFNPITKISFELADYAYAKLNIYNINGQLVEELVNGEYNPGYYSFNWNAKEYSSGVYFIKININNTFYETQKVMLVK